MMIYYQHMGCFRLDRGAKVCLGYKCGFIPVHDDGKACARRGPNFSCLRRRRSSINEEKTHHAMVVGLDGGFRESYSYTWLLVMAAGCMQLLQNILILPLYVYVVTLPMMKNVFT